MEPILTFCDPDQLSALLNQPSPNLEEILDQEGVAQEVKNYPNEQLVNYLIGPDIFEKLVSYVSQPPSDSSLHLATPYRDLKITKFPFVASEILSSNNDKIAKRFVGQEGELNSINTEGAKEDSAGPIQPKIPQRAPILKFLGFLDTPVPIDYTLAGYFCKVFKVIFQKEPECTAQLLFNSEYYKKIANHIYSDSVQEILLPILKLDATHFRATPGEHYVTQRIEIVQQLINNLIGESKKLASEDLDYDIQNNSSTVLCGLLGAVACYPNGKSIISPLLSSNVLHQLNQGLLNPTLTKMLTPLIKQLCTYHKNIYSSTETLPLLDLVKFTECIIPTAIPGSEPFIVAIIESLEGITNSLKADNHTVQAQAKVSLCEVIFAFLRLQNEPVDNKIIATKIFEVLLNMFNQNPWNNILHSELVKLFSYVIEHGSTAIKQALFEQAAILEFILKESSDPHIDFPSKTSSKTKKSYLAHLNVLATLIDTRKDSLVQSYINDNADWQAHKAESTKKEEKEKEKESTPAQESAPQIAAPLFGLEEMTSGQEEDPDAIMNTPMGGPKFTIGGGFSLGFGEEDESEERDECGWPVRDPEKTPKASKNIEWDDFC